MIWSDALTTHRSTEGFLGSERKSVMERQVAEMMRAYGEAERFLEAERAEWLSRLTPHEARALSEQLYAVWERGGRRAGGQWDALDRLQLEELVAVRGAFARLAHARGHL